MDFESTVTRLTKDLMKDFGLKEFQAAALAGNLAFESGNFKQLQEVKPLIPGSKGGYGFAQWTGERRKQFENYIDGEAPGSQKQPINPASYAANYGFLKKEFTDKNNKELKSIGINTIKRLKKTKNIEDANYLVYDYFLRPDSEYTHADQRLDRSKEVYNMLFSDTAPKESIRPQMRPQKQEVPAVAAVPQQVVPQQVDPLAIEQAVMEASATPVPPPSQPAIQQVPLRPTGGVIPFKLDEFNQGTSEVMPRRYADGTAEVIPEWLKSYSQETQDAYLRRQNTIQERDRNIAISRQRENDLNSYPIVDLQATGPVPGDMRGSPQGFAGLSDQQISQAFNEMSADRSAFNPVVPPYVPQPGDMLGYPKGQFRNSFGQMVQAAQENRADMSAFNPVVPPLVPDSALPTVPAGFAGDQAPMGEGLDLTQMSMNDLQVLSKRSPSLVPIIRQEITRRKGRKMDVARGDDGRNRVPSNYIADPRVKPYLQPGMTYTVDGNQVRYDPTVPPTNFYDEAGINRETVLNDMPANSYRTMQEAPLIELMNNGDELAAQEVIRRNDQANLNDIKVKELRDSGDTTVVPPNRPQITTELSPDIYEEQKQLDNVPDPATDNREKVINDLELSNNSGLNTSNDGQVTNQNGEVVKELTPAQVEDEANNAGSSIGDLLGKLGPIFKALFGLETQDMTRALGFYLMSRASGASHEGSMRWAGGTVLKQAEARNIRNSSRADAAAKAFTDIAGNYTKEAASKIRNALAKGNMVEAQALMDDAKNKTVRGKLGIDPNATGTFYMMPGYTKAVEVFEGTGGNRYTKVTVNENGKTVEKYIPISSQDMGSLRERNQDDDITSYLAAVRSHVNTMNPELFKEEYTDDKGNIVRPDGIFSGRSKAGVTEDIMKISKQQGEKGLPDDPREIMLMVSKAAELAESMGVKKINAETLFEMQLIGGDILFDQSKISKDGELVPASKIKSFTTDFQDILGNDRSLIGTTMNTAAKSFNPEMTIDSIKSTDNYNKLSSEQKSKIDSAPSAFMALALLTAYENKPNK